MRIDNIIDRYDLVDRMNRFGLIGDVAYIGAEAGKYDGTNLSHDVGVGVDFLGLYAIGKDIAYSTYADFHSFGVDVYTLAYDQKHGAPQTKLFSDRVKVLKDVFAF